MTQADYSAEQIVRKYMWVKRLFTIVIIGTLLLFIDIQMIYADDTGLLHTEIALNKSTLQKSALKKIMFPTEARPTKIKVALLLFDGVELLDFAGPGEVFQVADQGRAYHIYTVGPSTEPLVSQNFVTIIPEYSIANAPTPDLLIVPGGSPGSAFDNPAVMSWIRDTSETSEITLSVCNGALLLGKLGLLDNLDVTTHHSWIDWLAQIAPKGNVLANRRYIDSGRIVTTAGISAGIDGALHVVARQLGLGVAEKTAKQMEYVWNPINTLNYSR